MFIANSNKTLLIIPCGKKKIWDVKPSLKSVTAKDAYISTYFRLCRSYSERFADKWFILSGKYGIIVPDFIINNYNQRLSFSNEFKAKIKDQLNPLILKGTKSIISLCGRNYTQFLANVIRSFGLRVYAPLDGLKIGVRQKLLKECINNNNPLKYS